MENKRYRTKPSELDDVVNPNRDSVYQTDVFFALSCSRAKRAAPVHPRRNQRRLFEVSAPQAANTIPELQNRKRH
jgi:hypothetical protein